MSKRVDVGTRWALRRLEPTTCRREMVTTTLSVLIADVTGGLEVGSFTLADEAGA